LDGRQSQDVGIHGAGADVTNLDNFTEKSEEPEGGKQARPSEGSYYCADNKTIA